MERTRKKVSFELSPSPPPRPSRRARHALLHLSNPDFPHSPTKRLVLLDDPLPPACSNHIAVLVDSLP